MPKRLTATAAPAPKRADHTIERELTDAARRIRWQDGVTGLLGIAVLMLGYAAAMVVLDRWLVLPPWVRQLSFAGFLAALGTVGYFFILRPVQKSVNPRFIARRMEGTLADTKNEIINWVDMKDREIPGSIRTAVDARAAEGLAEADIAGAIRSGKVAWLGGIAMVLVGVLAVLFLVFKASQFTSLLGRAFNPFHTAAIGSRTTLELVEPEPAETTITDGEQIRFLVRIVGKKPSLDGPDRVRLLLKQSRDEQPEEIPFTPAGGNGRDFDLALGRSAIRNGFWYQVAGGDGVTAEHRIDVRTRPLVTGFEARYEYPAYTRMAADIGKEPRIEAHRGTAVTLTVKTNRTVKSGSIAFDGKPVPLAGEVVPEARDSLRFRFKLDERTNYRVQFTSTDNEASGPSPPYPIDVLLDRAPTVLIDAPEPDEIPLALNGLLAVDGTITDDFGLETATLVVRVPNPNGIPIDVRKKYLDGASLKREKDGVHPTALTYKDSIKLDGLKTEAGAAVALKADMLLEYWIEATDNCTEPKANVGRSATKRVKLTNPPAEPERKKEQDQKAGERQKDERNQQKGEKEKREQGKAPKPPQRPDRQPEKQLEPENKEPGDEKGDPMPQPGDKGNEKNKDETQKPMPGDNAKPNPDDVKKQADEIENKIKENNQEGGESKPNPNAGDKVEPVGSEPKPGEGKPKGDKADPAQASEPKEGDPKAGDGAAENKEPGKVQPPANSQEKPGPQEQPKGSNKPDEQPTGDKEKPEPRGGQTAGEEKANPPENKPMEQPKGSEAGEGKNAEPKPEEGKQPDSKKPAEGAGQAKPDGQPKPSQEKPSPKPDEQGGKGGEESKDGPPQPGEPKNQKPTEAGSKKPGPKEPPTGSEPVTEKQPPEAGSEKPEPGADKGAGEEKPAPMGQQPPPKGSEKNSKPSPGQGDKGDKGGQKPDPKEIADAVKDLDSPDAKKQQEARDKLDKAVGKEAREKAEQLQKDLKSDDMGKREAAQKEIDDLKKQAGAGGDEKPKEPTKEEIEEFKKNAKDLASKDDATRKAAEQKLDRQIGKENREAAQKKAEQLEKDLKSDDKAKRDAAEGELERLANEASKNQPKKEQRPGDAEQLKRDAENLANSDDAQRQEAERKLDEQLGKEARDDLQKEAKDAAGPDPELAKKAKDNLDKKVKDQARKQGGNPGDGGKGQDGKPLEENAANRLKTDELKLDQFRKYRGNKEFLKQSSMTDAEYENFLRGYEEMVAKQKSDLEAAKLNPPSARPDGPATVGTNDGSGNRIERNPTGPGVAGPGGAGVSPPGFGEAQNGFTVPRRPKK